MLTPRVSKLNGVQLFFRRFAAQSPHVLFEPHPRPNSHIDSWEITSVLPLGLQIEPHRLPKPRIVLWEIVAVVLLRSLHCLRLRPR